MLSEFQYWLDNAKPGSIFTYATCGTLGASAETLATAEHAKRAYGRGLIELCQRLRKDKDGRRDGFDYLAIRRKLERTPLVHGDAWQVKIVTSNHWRER